MLDPYRELLKKYIRYVTDCEGIDFIEGGYIGYSDDEKFDEAEWAVLTQVANEAHKERES